MLLAPPTGSMQKGFLLLLLVRFISLLLSSCCGKRSERGEKIRNIQRFLFYIIIIFDIIYYKGMKRVHDIHIIKWVSRRSAVTCACLAALHSHFVQSVVQLQSSHEKRAVCLVGNGIFCVCVCVPSGGCFLF